ncbi:MAG: KamA family radical SAM protein [Proteobacteria bacterium]|nr:KamA family radical SAM protein [Pseudomonadota bacterium]MBU1649373.1 KamA family radical SAM protein [Pseudomonadota bacterium]MBU1985812.1 KamA family radical SAM protein [Pseudomonadota bacterium]
MKKWQEILRDSITSPAALNNYFNVNITSLDKVIATFPMRINPYYLKLIQKIGDPLWKQAIPDVAELHDSVCIEDPLAEENLSPVPNLVHKYPDRVLFLISNQCAMYCRFCTRKRKVGTGKMLISQESILSGLDYIRHHPQVREVLLSGGDPLLLPDSQIEFILHELRSIPSVKVIRIGTRVPCTLPMRITPELVTILRKYHPLYINTHFNHPAEITPEASTACTLLADAGIPMGCQTVLLKGVNDNTETMRELLLNLLEIRVKPYYLFQTDLTRGTNHFRTPTTTGIRIMRNLIGHISGLAVPTFALDGPGGKGKIPLTPDYILTRGDKLVFENYRGEICTYPESGDGI